MTGDSSGAARPDRTGRARGVALYAGAGVLLAAGAFWWFAAAPGQPRDDRLAEWTASALRRVPDHAAQQGADTVPLPAGAEHEVVVELSAGAYVVTVVCVGAPRSLVRVSLGRHGTDSGQGLHCSGDNVPRNLSVSVADELRLSVTVNDAGPVVFRYSALRSPD